MSNRVTESIVVTSAGVIHDLEQFPPASGALDYTSLAFEHVLVSLARLEARFDALQRRQAIAQPPPRPDPKPPYLDWQRGRVISGQSPTQHDPDPPIVDWQRGREISGRRSAIATLATAVSSIPQLGTVATQQHGGFSGPSTRVPQQRAVSELLACDRYGNGKEGVRGRRLTAWDNPAHRMDEPEPPYEEWQRRRGNAARHRLSPEPRYTSQPHIGFVNPSARTASQVQGLELLPCDRYGADVEVFRGRRFTAWDNPAHRCDDQPGRLETEWDNTWKRQEVGRMEDQPRYDHYRVEQPRYEKMRAPRFDGSDVVNWISRELRPENSEVSNSASKAEICSDLGDADSLVVHSNQDVETDPKLEVVDNPAHMSDYQVSFDSVAEVLSKVAKDPGLIELESDEANGIQDMKNDEPQRVILINMSTAAAGGGDDKKRKQDHVIDSNNDPQPKTKKAYLLGIAKKLSNVQKALEEIAEAERGVAASRDKLVALLHKFDTDEGRRAAIRCVFDPGGDVSQQFLAFNSRRCFVVSTLRTR